MEKHYGVRTPRDACGPLLQRLIVAGRTDGGSDGGAGETSGGGGGGRGGSKAASLLPRVMRGARGTILLHVSHNNLLFVGVTHQEVCTTQATGVRTYDVYVYAHASLVRLSTSIRVASFSLSFSLSPHMYIYRRVHASKRKERQRHSRVKV